MNKKPLGYKNYGSIGHLPNSRLGDGDHSVHEGQARICTEKSRDYKDRIIVQEKLDGSNVGVAKLENGQIIALGRSGYTAESSPFFQHRLFAEWVNSSLNLDRFFHLLNPGERAVGEWIAQAHGTMYDLIHEPFVMFDIMIHHERILYSELLKRAYKYDFITPALISLGQPIDVKSVLKKIKNSAHGAVDMVEGAVWRVEREGKVDFLAKYVRHDKVDGKYLESKNETGETVWNSGLERYIS